MRKLIALLFLPLLVISCKKEEATITGHLFKSCSDGPLANTLITFRHRKVLKKGKGDIVAMAKTDQNGFFTLQYKYRAGDLMTMYIDGKEFVNNVPTGKTIDLGTLYLHPAIYPAIRVQVTNPHADASGTLWFNAIYNPWPHCSMTPPLHDTVFPAKVAADYDESVVRSYDKLGTGTMQQKIYWYLNGIGIGGNMECVIPYCSETPDTIVVTID